MTNSSTVAMESTVPPKIPVLRIVPPSRWWVLPVAELWAYRELLYFFVWRDIKIRYKQTALGASWALLQPLLAMAVFTLFFGRLAHLPSEGLPYPIFSYCGLLPWMYFAAALQNATNTIVENQRLVTKVYFPKLDLPLSSVLSGLMDFGISFLMFVALMIYYHIHPSVSILWFPVFLLLAVLTALGRALAVRAKRHLSRRSLRAFFPGPVLDVCFSGGVSEFDCAGKMAMVVRVESDGRSDRRISLVPHGTWRSVGPFDFCFFRSCDSGVTRRRGVFPKNGN